MIIFYYIICNKFYIFLVYFSYHFLCSPSQLIECLFGLYLCFHKDDVVFCPKPKVKKYSHLRSWSLKKMWNTFFFLNELLRPINRSSRLIRRFSFGFKSINLPQNRSTESWNTQHTLNLPERIIRPKRENPAWNQVKLRSPQNVSGAWQKNSVAAFLLNIWSRW